MDYPTTVATPSTPFVGWSPISFEAKNHNGVWESGQIKRDAKVTLDATSAAIQFGQSVFEGMTAWLGDRGDVFLFRAADHYARLAASCSRLAIPIPPFGLFERAMHKTLKEPTQFQIPLSSRLVYIRPLVFGTTSHIMPMPSTDYLFTVSVAPYFPAAIPESLRLKVEHRYHRTAEHGLGNAKTASNYAHQYAPTELSKQQGYDALLWLESSGSRRISEASSMNVFFDTVDGIVTPSLNEHLLPGLTRDSAIRIARDELGLHVIETPITVGDVEKWHHADGLLGMFITSTARGIRPVSALNLLGGDIIFDTRKNDVCAAIAKRLNELKEGRGYDPYGWRTMIPAKHTPRDQAASPSRHASSG